MIMIIIIIIDIQYIFVFIDFEHRKAVSTTNLASSFCPPFKKESHLGIPSISIVIFPFFKIIAKTHLQISCWNRVYS